jgi:hypothetical protein
VEPERVRAREGSPAEESTCTERALSAATAAGQDSTAAEAQASSWAVALAERGGEAASRGAQGAEAVEALAPERKKVEP